MPTDDTATKPCRRCGKPLAVGDLAWPWRGGWCCFRTCSPHPEHAAVADDKRAGNGLRMTRLRLTRRAA